MALKRLSGIVFFRASLFLAFLALIILVVLGLAAVQTEGELKVVAHIFSATKDSATLREFSQLNTLYPIPVDGTPLREVETGKIDEMLVRYYLGMRYEQVPDEAEMVYRWGIGGPLYMLSFPSVYNEFAGNLEKKIASLPNSVSSIEVKEVVRAGNVFTVTFFVHENLPNRQRRTKMKNAVIEFTYLKARRRFTPIFTNPFGFIVIRFEETEVKSSKE